MGLEILDSPTIIPESSGSSGIYELWDNMYYLSSPIIGTPLEREPP